MTDGKPEQRPKRPPRVFDPNDRAVVREAENATSGVAPLHGPGRKSAAGSVTAQSPTTSGDGEAAAASSFEPRARIGWSSLLLGALGGLITLAAGLWFAEFVSVALQRTDWIGTLAWGLTALAALAAVVITGREVIGLMRLTRLSQLRRDAERVVRAKDLKAERAVVRRLRSALSGRRDIAWAVARFREHERDVRDPGDLIALADRELLAPLDAEARRAILAAAKRVSVATALSPIPFIAVGFVAYENLRLLRKLATLYGGRPGFFGGLKLARLVLVHIVATGGLALTDDLIGQFIGQDLVRRLSRRLGEGLFNGALTARVGAAAIEITRPLPFIEASPVRVRDMIGEFMRRNPPTKVEGK